MAVKNHLKLLIEYFKISLASAMEYKTNFLIQITAMALNDAVWIVFWWIFFTRFTAVNGWVWKDMLMMYAVITVSYGLTGVFFGNKGEIARIIATGKLDFYLTLPKNSIWHMLISRSSWFAAGDLVFGLIVACFCLTPAKIPLFIILCLTSIVIFIAFGILVGSLSFFWGGSEESSKNILWGMLALSTYPITIFQGYTKIILLTLIPAGFVSGIPVELLKSFSLTWFMLTLAFSIALLAISIIVFKKGLKRYESGNLINVRI